ncbi:MAG: hypothetical protein LKJ76_07325 [Lachnospiraceae bacterium]|jgi:hypothetical protein|nr:hypothetical protein [Lachnospiraceae bacterium]
MNEYERILIFGLAGLIILGVAITLVVDTIRKKDFKDQLSGRKPERKVHEKQEWSYDKKEAENPQISIDREILRTRGGQNLMGPK